MKLPWGLMDVQVMVVRVELPVVQLLSKLVFFGETVTFQNLQGF